MRQKLGRGQTNGDLVRFTPGPQMPPILYFPSSFWASSQDGDLVKPSGPGAPSTSQPLLLSGKIWWACLLTLRYKKGQVYSTVWRAAGARGPVLE